MFNKIKKEWLFIFLFLAGSLIFFDLVGVNYSGITGAQITDTNINAINNAFTGLFRIFFEGFIKPFFDLFNISETRIVIIRAFFALFLFTILYHSFIKLNVFGRDPKQKRTASIVMSGGIALISAAYIPRNILELFFGCWNTTGASIGSCNINIFSSLLGFVFVFGTIGLLIYSCRAIAGQDPQNNRSRSILAGIIALLTIFIIIFITTETRNSIVDNLKVVFDIAFAISLLWAFVYFIMYTFVHGIFGGAGAGVGGVPGAQPPQQIQDRGELRTVLQRYLQEQQRFLNALGANLNDGANVRRQRIAFHDNLELQFRDINNVGATVLGRLDAHERVRTETALNRIRQIDTDLRDRVDNLDRNYAGLTPAQRNNIFNNINHLFHHKQQEVNRV